ncbi:MAG TPA: Ig-like domain-containing protein, partial [Treponemataceae bacterium]|nr:Ig-like domain-containing protein [Treponemataceae bacterium]
MVKTTRPRNGDTPVRNTSIKIYFTKPIDVASFKYSDDTFVDTDGNFKNITIMGLNGDPGLQDYVSKTEYFKPPVLSEDGKMLTITPNKDKGYLPPFTDMYITISKAISDGLYTMPSDYILEYTLSDKMDSQPPVISIITGGLDSAASSFISLNNATHRVGSGSIYLAVTASDASTGGAAVSTIRLYETRTHDPSGNAVSEGKLAWSSGFEENSPLAETFVFPYKLQKTSDGIYVLEIMVQDANGNWTPDDGASKYVVIRDTSAPDAASNAARITPGGKTAGGFFNGENNTRIVFNDTGKQIVDFGYMATPTEQGRTWSDTVYWSFRLGESKTWSEYKPTSETLNLEIPSSVADGLVPVYVRFKDDLENESAIATLSSVYKDTAKPTGSVSVQDTKSIDLGGVTYEMIGNATPTVSVTGA